MPGGFCIQGNIDFPPCKEFVFGRFPNEKDAIVLILEYFKRFLPQILNEETDYYDRPIVIDPKDIGLSVQKEPGAYVVILSITDDNSTYPDDQFFQEDTVYAFQLDLWVHADHSDAALESLIKLKSAVKTLLVNMERNLDLYTFPGDFSYGEFGIDESRGFVRQGTYRFSIETTNFRK